MKLQNHYFSIAICLALVLHGAVLELGDWSARGAKIWLPPLHRPDQSVLLALAALPEEEMGDRNGKGTASDASDGLTPLQSRAADEDQPLLSRDPTPRGPAVKKPMKPDAPAGEGGHGGQRGAAVAAALAPQTPPSKPARQDNAAPTPPVREPAAETAPPPPNPSAPVKPPTLALATPGPPAPLQQTPQSPQPPQPQNDATPAPPVSSPQVATGDALAPGQTTSADPAQRSDSDSDPFTKVGTAVFRDGRLEIRAGRRIKTVRPHLLVPGILDIVGARDPTVVLKINIDATGKVTLVNVLRSSGSNDIDQPCVIAVYDWWFEPSRDAQGHPIPDVVIFTISFR